MNICEFLTLDETEQTEVVWTNFHIAEREDNTYWILLYQVDEFYVELFYNKKKQEICGLRPFVCTDLLQPYLDNICIDALLQ